MNELSLDWRSVGLRGIAAVAFGVLTLVWPGLTITALLLLFGVYVLVDLGGAFSVIFGIILVVAPVAGALAICSLSPGACGRRTLGST